jgi:carboxypeptidase Taq
LIIIKKEKGGKKIKNYYALEGEIEEISHLDNILKISKWDFTTYMPELSSLSRQKEIATLAANIHKMKSSSKIGGLIKKSSQEQKHLNSWQDVNLHLIKKQYEETKIVPVELERKYSEASFECEFLWRSCRINNDYKSIAPYFDKLFSLIRQITQIKSEYLNKSKYDVLLDQFDPERKLDELKPIFQKTKDTLPNLIHKIIEKQSTEKFFPLTEEIDQKTQKAIEYRLMAIMGFDLKRGRLDESAHPFCGGTVDDTRITTSRFEENLLISSYSVIHELGHGLYQQNLPSLYKNQLIGNFKGFAFHESQSLIMEKQIGTSLAFLEFYTKLLSDEFGIKGKEYSAENLFKIKTRVKPSFIRIDADEVTYPMHVILRSEIEEKIINGEIAAVDLPEIWNEKMQTYLGITPDTYANGCLQDIHWPSGLFGYFPCYYVGALTSSMLMQKMKQEGKVDNLKIADGNFEAINSYLNKNFRQYGSRYEAAELLQKSTGHNKLKTDIFFDYIKDKYLGI